MKRIFTITSFAFLISCNNQGEKQTGTTTPAFESEPAATTEKETETKKPLPEFAYPVAMANWTLGDPGNTKTVLDVYKAWEQKDSAVFAAAFADSVTMDMPDKRRLILTRGNAYKKLLKARSIYRSITNHIVSAYAMHNEENNADWVMVMVYNKWIYTDGIKDSALYWDNWRLKDGKIAYLNSLAQAPPKTLLRVLESKFD